MELPSSAAAIAAKAASVSLAASRPDARASQSNGRAMYESHLRDILEDALEV